MIGCVSELCRYTVPELMNGPADIASVGAAAWGWTVKGPAAASGLSAMLSAVATALTLSSSAPAPAGRLTVRRPAETIKGAAPAPRLTDAPAAGKSGEARVGVLPSRV